MAVVAFDSQAWLEVYPEFKGKITDAQLQFCFDLACQILDNTDASPVPYDPDKGIETRRILLWLLVCHIAALALRPVGQAGTLTSATQGSVSTGFQLPNFLNGQYFNQTPCGQSYWQTVKKFIIGGRYYDIKKFHPWG